MSSNKRCFAFGCSYTDYTWPTFADLVGCNFGEFYNFGRSGSDNTYALNRLIDTHSIFGLNPKTDFVIFGVTGFGRYTYWDRQIDWYAEGDLDFISKSNFEPVEQSKFYVKEKYSPIYAAYKSINAIKMFKYFLQGIGIPHVIYPALDNAEFCVKHIYQHDRKPFIPVITEQVEKVSELYDIKISIDEFMIENNEFHTKTYFRKEDRYDTHPTTDIHYRYMKRFMPKYDTKRVQAVVSQFQSKEYKSKEELGEIMAKKFAFLYRKDYSIEPSLFLRHNDVYRNMYIQYKDSGV